MSVKFREYRQGDIYRLILDGMEQYNMQFLREDVLMNNIAFTGTYNDTEEIVGCAGLAEMWSGVYEAWIALNEKYKKIWDAIYPVLSVLKNSLDHMPESVVRIHAHMNIDTYNQERLMEFLGFTKEAVLHKYFPFKKDCILYRRLY